MSDWPERKVIDLQNDGLLLVADGNHGNDRPRRDEFCEVGTSFIRAADMDNGRLLFESAQCVNDTAMARIRKGVGAGGDVILSHKGTVGKVAYVPLDAPPFVCSPQTTFWRTLDNDQIDRRYLYAFLNSHHFRNQLYSRANETDMAGYVSLTSQRGLKVVLPPIEEQRAIASILGALDDKIELNRRMNATLESLARAIFKSWFVDFDPVKINAGQMPASSAIPTTHDPKVLDLFPSTFQDSELGPIPEGWSVKPLSDVCDLLSGGTPKKKIEEYWNGNLPWISPKAMNGIHVFESDSSVTEAAVGNGTRLVPAGTTLVMVRGMGLHQGVRISQAQRDVTFNQDVKALVPTTVDSTFLLYAMLDAAPILFGKVRAAGHGTGVLSTDIIKSLEFPVPKDGLSELTQPLTELNQEIHSNELESQVLAELRDALLPQLLSGELPVPEALTATENALV